MVQKYFLMIGNGFTRSYIKHCRININSSKPFDNPIDCPFSPKESLLDCLPELKRLRTLYRNETDFGFMKIFANTFMTDLPKYTKSKLLKIISTGERDKISEYTKEYRDFHRPHCNLRQYLALTYYHYSKKIASQWKPNWIWENWIKNHCDDIVGVFDFNYDLTLEFVLSKLGLKYYRISTNEEKNGTGIPIFKPHGSCDFDVNERGIRVHPKARLKNSVWYNETGLLKIIPDNELEIPRVEADIIIPHEKNTNLGLHWVDSGYVKLGNLIKQTDSCIITGIRYEEADRPEINYCISRMQPNSLFYYIAGNQNYEFESSIKNISKNVHYLNYQDPNHLNYIK